MLQVWTMKLIESTNICYISDRGDSTIKVNIEKILMGNDGFLQMFMWWMNFSQRIITLLLDKFSIYWGKVGFLLLYPHSGKPKVDVKKFAIHHDSIYEPFDS